MILVESISKGNAIRDFLEGSSLNKGSSRKDAVKCEVIDCLNGVTYSMEELPNRVYWLS